MLVYANSFVINPVAGRQSVTNLVAGWVSKSRNASIDATLLSTPSGEIKLPNRTTFSWNSTSRSDGPVRFPFSFCARLTHGQEGVTGRLLSTEVGMRQDIDGGPIECSVLFETSDVSARVNAPIQVTRPRIVETLIDNCRPASETPGLNVLPLTAENAKGFEHSVEYRRRRHPIIVLSADREGRYPVDAERIRSLTVGLAQVVKISPDTDTFKLQEIIGRRFIAFGGAVNIISPPRVIADRMDCKTTRIHPEQIEDLVTAGSTVEAEIMSILTHNTNLPHSWRHTSMDKVAQAILSHRLEVAVASASSSDDTKIYESLLQEASGSISQSEEKIAGLQRELSDVQEALEFSDAEAKSLKHALSGVQSRTVEMSDDAAEVFAPFRDAMIGVLSGAPTLEQGIRAIGSLYSDRVVVLDSAISAARESDRGGFKYSQKAFGFFRKLAQDYWEALAGGKNDQQARAAFGNAYAAKEAETLSKNGRDLRTFRYRNEDVLMERHLKIGVKDSLSETLRIHFEWYPDEQKIVIGHCGRHLNF
ncbi:hypothetical protein DSM25559_5280 [Agrobacterium rosae]|uniref:Uncharacterized protein n=1 Tax=Agrobacterium rosae TaxID=1972867 RepID=A0A1R3U6E9_9HYPH|nr:hypothetical protein DSM25559_5280 [Agrobacterium rosae]